MKYWIYSQGNIFGPCNAAELFSVAAFGPASLVCPEGLTGENEGDWKTADSFPELACVLSAGVASCVPAFGQVLPSLAETSGRTMESAGNFLPSKTSGYFNVQDEISGFSMPGETEFPETEESYDDTEAFLARFQTQPAGRETSWGPGQGDYSPGGINGEGAAERVRLLELRLKEAEIRLETQRVELEQIRSRQQHPSAGEGIAVQESEAVTEKIIPVQESEIQATKAVPAPAGEIPSKRLKSLGSAKPAWVNGMEEAIKNAEGAGASVQEVMPHIPESPEKQPEPLTQNLQSDETMDSPAALPDRAEKPQQGIAGTPARPGFQAPPEPPRPQPEPTCRPVIEPEPSPLFPQPSYQAMENDAAAGVAAPLPSPIEPVKVQQETRDDFAGKVSPDSSHPSQHTPSPVVNNSDSVPAAWQQNPDIARERLSSVQGSMISAPDRTTDAVIAETPAKPAVGISRAKAPQTDRTPVKKAKRKPAFLPILVIFMALASGGIGYFFFEDELGLSGFSLFNFSAGGKDRKPAVSAVAHEQERSASAAGTSAPLQPGTDAEESQPVPEQPRQQTEARSGAAEKEQRAVELVKSYELEGGRGVVDSWFQNSFLSGAPAGSHEEWTGTILHADIYVVQYRLLRPRAEPLVYQFEVDIAKGVLVRGVNNAAIELLRAESTGARKTIVRAPKRKKTIAPARKAVRTRPEPIYQLPLPEGPSVSAEEGLNEETPTGFEEENEPAGESVEHIVADDAEEDLF
ncbi:MAG: hypothetical protein ABIG11_01640 [bacterium]